MTSLVSSQGERFAILPDRPTKVGRSEDNDIVIRDGSVSRHHALISITDGDCRVRDLESANGTFVGGQKISDAPLVHGDRVQFGDIEFVFDSPGVKSASAAPWWKSRTVQAAALAAVGIILVLSLRHHQTTESQPGPLPSAPAASLAGQIPLPQASLDFVGTWSGAVPLVMSRPPSFITATTAQVGLTFYNQNGAVVMSVASYATRDTRVLKITAAGLDNRHVILEQDLRGTDTLGQPLWEHDKVEITLVSRNQLDCIKTSDFYHDLGGTTSVAQAVYHGALNRISEAEREREIHQIERSGMTKQAETRAPISKR